MKKTNTNTITVTTEATTFTLATLANIPESLATKVNTFNKSKSN